MINDDDTGKKETDADKQDRINEKRVNKYNMKTLLTNFEEDVKNRAISVHTETYGEFLQCIPLPGSKTGFVTLQIKVKNSEPSETSPKLDIESFETEIEEDHVRQNQKF